MAHFEKSVLTRPMNFNFATDVVDYWATKEPSLEALLWVSGDLSQTRSFTFRYFSEKSHRISVLFIKLGIEKGDRLLIISSRIPEWWEVVVACLRSSVVVCPAPSLLVERDIQYRCERTRATVFVGDTKSIEQFMRIREHCPSIKTIIHIENDGNIIDASVLRLQDALAKITPDARFDSGTSHSGDPALIYFTSGTSGPPKMVQHNRVSYPLAHLITGKRWLGLRPGKLYWNLSDQGWGKAAWSLFGAWNCGAALFIHDERQSFSPTRTLHILNKYPITSLCGPPTVYRYLVLAENLRYMESNPPKALQSCNSAGEPLNDEVIRVWRNMTGLEIKDGYGQTETALICGNLNGCPVRPGSMGKPPAEVPLSVLDGKGMECLPGQDGEICISLSADGLKKAADSYFFGLFDGYIGDDGSLTRNLKDFGGKTWYCTGDRATKDADGYVWFVGRADDVISSSGYRIGPFEVESVLKLHPGVVESAVVASPDLMRGEIVSAFVVLTSEYASKAEDSPGQLVKELQTFCKKHAAPYKYPRKIRFVDGGFLPKTISGKIKRNELKAMETNGVKLPAFPRQSSQVEKIKVMEFAPLGTKEFLPMNGNSTCFLK